MGFYSDLKKNLKEWKRNFLIKMDHKIDKLREIERGHFNLRITGLDGLTKPERHSILTIIKDLGYNSLEEFSQSNGYSSIREMAYNYRFKNVRDFFLAGEWYERLAKYDRRVKSNLTNKL